MTTSYGGCMDRVCEKCQHYDESAYAFKNISASGRICEKRDPYEPDLSPFRSHPRFPFVTHSGSCCRAFESRPASEYGRLF